MEFLILDILGNENIIISDVTSNTPTHTQKHFSSLN